MPAIPWRLWAALGAVIALAVTVLWLRHVAYREGHQDGSAKVQAAWDADTERRTRVWQGEIQRQAQITQEVERELSQKLAAAHSRGHELANRLLRYQAELAAARLAAAAAAPDGTRGESADPADVGAALADHLAACERDATRLTELQTWVGEIRRPTPP